MRKWLKRILIIIVTALTIPALVYHFGLREWCLHWGTVGAEAHGTLPGDELFPVYAAEATHAITIHASPDKIWPWLMQMGQDRSGFYSYTFLENAFGCDMPKVERLVPDWKPRTRGETVWFCNPKRFNGQGKMIPAVVETDRAFAMVGPANWQSLQTGGHARDGFWSFTISTHGKWRKPAHCSRVQRTAAHTYIACNGTLVLGACPLRHGAEDAPQDSRPGGT